MIEVLLPLPSGTDLLDLNRALFSINCQTYRELEVILFIEADDVRSFDPLIDMFDWSSFHRKPYVVRRPRSSKRTNDVELSNFAVRYSKGRRFSIFDPAGMLYAAAYQMLYDASVESTAAVVYGDGVLKEVRRLAGCLYEYKRDYETLAWLGPWELKNGRIPLLGACLFDRGRISQSDIVFDAKAGCYSEQEFVLRLLRKYSSRRIAQRLPVFAQNRNPFSIGASYCWQRPFRVGERPTTADALLQARRQDLKDRLEGRRPGFLRTVASVLKTLVGRTV